MASVVDTKLTIFNSIEELNDFLADKQNSVMSVQAVKFHNGFGDSVCWHVWHRR